MFKDKIKTLLFPGTNGLIALSNFFICILSGVFLSLPYDSSNAFISVTRLVLTNPPASFIRNIHYWSAQLFLIFTFIHLWEQIRNRNDKNIRFPVWIRLVISILIVFYLMLSGFILKADNDSIQAQIILSNMIGTIPFIGKKLSLLLVGENNSILVIYLHHIATATLISFIIIFEHSKVIWGKTNVFITYLIIVVILGIFFTAPLSNSNTLVVKGPWYLTGTQELLYLLKKPEWVIAIVLLILSALTILPKISVLQNKFVFGFFNTLIVIYLIFTISGFYFRGENWQRIFPWQKAYFNQVFWPVCAPFNPFKDVKQNDKTWQKQESCIICHGNMTGLSSSHNPDAIGCTSCHLGNPFTLNKKASHKHIVKQPGNLETANLSCGTAKCHPEITDRIMSNIMTTMSGIISVDRYVLDEQTQPSILSHISEIKNSKADIHLKNLCTHCHLGREKNYYGPLKQMTMGGGCLACHLSYSEECKNELKSFNINSKVKKGYLLKQHPDLNLNIGNSACFACHSRSGRISLSYEGWYETLLQKHQITNQQKKYRLLADGRILQKFDADLHHKAGLKCIDCHNSYELMGDGKQHIHKEQQLQVQCIDCHQKPPFKMIEKNKIDKESLLILSLKNYSQSKFPVYTKSGKPIINAYVNKNDSVYLISKSSRKQYLLKSFNYSCSNPSHKELSCEACHTSTVPRCIGCHTAFNKTQTGNNTINAKHTQGKWTEYAGEFVVGPPTLGVKYDGKLRTIVTMMPGMIMTYSKTDKKDTIFKRLYAPANPHTTTKPEQNCKNCHLNPVMLGFGKGLIKIEEKNKQLLISFEPYYAENKYDNLPADAWIGFLENKQFGHSTRNNIRPFSKSEQIRILTVGSCFYCHNESSKMIFSMLSDYKTTLLYRTKNCFTPVFK